MQCSRLVVEFLEITLKPHFSLYRLHLFSPQSDHLLHAESQLPSPVHIMFVVQPIGLDAPLPARQLGHQQFGNGAAVVDK